MGSQNASIEKIKKYQWKPGQSGNPLGRPKGSRNISTILKEILDYEISARDPISGEKITVPISTIVNARLVRKAMDGDNKAIREIYDRIEGRPKQKLDVTADMKVKDFLNNCMNKAMKGDS